MVLLMDSLYFALYSGLKYHRLLLQLYEFAFGMNVSDLIELTFENMALTEGIDLSCAWENQIKRHNRNR